MEVWGSGTPHREFLHVDDLADALVFLAKHYSDELHINVGSGEEVSIDKAARIVAEAVGYRGQLIFDRSKPDGAPRKLADSTRLSGLGWTPSVRLVDGIRAVYNLRFGPPSRATKVTSQ
jgi:GDP-L-fucose synthase